MGYDVEECGGSKGEPAALDDSEDWAWVPETVLSPSQDDGPIRLGDVISETLARAAHATSEAFLSTGEAMRETIAGFPAVVAEEHTLTTEQLERAIQAATNRGAVREAMTSSTVPQSLRPSHVAVNGVDITDIVSSMTINEAPDLPLTERHTAMRHAARDLRDALETVLADVTGQRQSVHITPEPDGRGGAQLHGYIQPDGFQFATHIPAPVLADQAALDDLIRRATAEARTQLERRFRPSSADFFRNAARSSEIQYTGDAMSEPIARVLVEVRQAYIDVTGAPPEDADMQLGDSDYTDGLQTLTLRLRAPSGELQVSAAISPSVFGEPGYAEEVARDVGRFVRRELRERIPEPGAGP
ncbi:hypothetical protein [Streptomyces sp. OK228]|uniref:hypothetical protein n=1 Tax=Streptomyces sp. OK228 TaxID=1882786 RepID=UPI001180B5D5|nr:hypothetical protein [Streptomyces sp. OK228]